MQFRSVHTVDEALDALGELGADATVLAGGTDVMIQLQRGELNPATLLHVERLTSLADISDNGAVALGALATHETIARSPLLAGRYDGIAHAASVVGGWQTQVVGTVGGNVCNASPAADLLPPLLANGAVLTLASRSRGERTVPLDRFVVGRRATAREPDELLTELRLDPVPDRTADTYVKVGRRGAMDVAIVGVAVRLTLAEDGQTVADARIGVCSVAPVPFRALAAERVLVGSTADADAVGEAGRLLVEQAEPIDDPRGTARYRRMVLPRVLAQAIDSCRSRLA